MMESRIFRILAIDGGGIRGVFPAHLLSCIEKRLGIDILKNVDMVAGTSTGAIIAAGIACGKSPAKIEDFYHNHGRAIFSEQLKSRWPKCFKPGFHSKYSSDRLKTILQNEFSDCRLGQIKKPLLLPATDIGNGVAHVFKSNYFQDFTRDEKVLVRDAL